MVVEFTAVTAAAGTELLDSGDIDCELQIFWQVLYRKNEENSEKNIAAHWNADCKVCTGNWDLLSGILSARQQRNCILFSAGSALVYPDVYFQQQTKCGSALYRNNNRSSLWADISINRGKNDSFCREERSS